LIQLQKLQKDLQFSQYAKNLSPLFKPDLTWIPGNGKNILIWEDSILGDPPLDTLSGTSNLKRWLHSQSLTVLWDISIWNNDEIRTWKKWSILNCPSHLHNEELLLLSLLQGKSPIASHTKDSRGWGAHSGNYTAAQGYKSLKQFLMFLPTLLFGKVYGKPKLCQK
jgi:hypothetical protein